MADAWATGAGIALDHDGDVPLGVQLDWSIRAAVASGRLRAGERLPGLREVAAQLGVNHNTVRAAVAKLEADGVLETRHGAGTFVAAGAGGGATTGHAELLGDVTQQAQAAGGARRGRRRAPRPGRAARRRDAAGAGRGRGPAGAGGGAVRGGAGGGWGARR